jgi:hypothetical protein
MSAKADRARRRNYEKREVDQWVGWGWDAELTWREMRGFIPGKRIPIIKNRDFFEKFDAHAVHPETGQSAWIQVTETSFEKTRETRGRDRNAEHGGPRWGFVPPDCTVEAFALAQQAGYVHYPAAVQVLVSYADPRRPVRRWWVRKVG